MWFPSVSVGKPRGPRSALVIAALSIAMATARRTLRSERIGPVPFRVMCVKLGPAARRTSTSGIVRAGQLARVARHFHRVDLAVGQRVRLRVRLDHAKDQRVELGRISPPFLVADE